MEYRYIGRSGLRVSPVGLGTMTFGLQCNKAEAFRIMDRAYDRGINFFDTAELYPVPPRWDLCGITEEIVGEWLGTKPRDAVILATKVAGAASGWYVPPVRHGLTAIDAFHIERGIEGSLRRLKTDYIDLYQIHWPDSIVPIEEALEVLDRLVKSGKVRYIGTSNDTAYGLTKAICTSGAKGFKRFESIQNNFSLLNRRFLDSIAEVCQKEKVSLLAYSPLAGGVLSGKYNQKEPPKNSRFMRYLGDESPRVRAMANRYLNDRTLSSVERYIKIAHKMGISVATLAIAWAMDFDFVASVLIGATEASQLDETLLALDTKLPEDIRAECDLVHQEIPYPMG